MPFQDDIHRALASSGRSIAALTRTLPRELALFRPEPSAWCALEILNHLADEDQEDFGLRLRLTLEDSGKPFPPIDPEQWVVDRDYQSREVEESLDRFLDARAANLTWLRSLPTNTNWDQLGPTPPGLRAGDLALAWVDHDLAHLSQLASVLAQAMANSGLPFLASYSGSFWPKKSRN